MIYAAQFDTMNALIAYLLANTSAVNVAACAESDDVPYSADCLALFGKNWQSDHEVARTAMSPSVTELSPKSFSLAE